MQQDAETPAMTDAATGQAERLLARLVLAQATDLARAGRMAEAEQVLGAGDTVSPAGLDLLARIRIQQGRLLEAQTLWREAAKREPGNGAFHAALQKLARMNRWSWMTHGALSLGKVILVLAALALSAIPLRNWWSGQRTGLAKAVWVAAPSPPSSAVSQLGLRLQQTREAVADGILVIRFDRGLFSHADVLSAEGKSELENLGLRLRPQARRLIVCVVGVSDDLPVNPRSRYRDNHFLALARADAAAAVLAAASDIPASQITLRSSAGPLYPNDTADNRARNRTVEVRIADFRP
jgi:flagellar motor protein MotB